MSKYLILLLLSVSTSFACPNLTGVYACGDELMITQTYNKEGKMLLKISVQGDSSAEYIVDRHTHNTSTLEKYRAYCVGNKAITIKNESFAKASANGSEVKELDYLRLSLTKDGDLRQRGFHFLLNDREVVERAYTDSTCPRVKN